MTFDIQDYLSQHTHIHHTTRGDEIVCSCPECGRPDKLWVNAKTGHWICYKCARGGHLIQLVMFLEHLPWAAAKAALIEGGGLVSQTAEQIKEAGYECAPVSVVEEIKLPDEFIPCFNRETRMRTWPTYLTERKVSVRTAITYGLGTCQKGRYGGRLVIPVRMHGKLRTFTARSLTGVEPKYLHPPDDHKSGALFGLDEAIGARRVVLVEGPFDVFGIVRAGMVAVGLLGKQMTDEQHGALAKAGFRSVVTMLDPDAAAENRAIERRLATTFDEVKRATLPNSNDPGDAPEEMLLAAVANAR